MADDSGTGWSAPVPEGGWTQPFPENSQCRIRGAMAPGPEPPDDYYWGINIEFKTAFAGNNNIYMKAVDAGGLTADWKPMGTWNVFINAAPRANAVTPSAGSGLKQVFRVIYADPNGADDVRQVGLTIAVANQNQAVCSIHLELQREKVYLLKDDTSGYLGPAAVGAKESVQGGFCGVDASGIVITRMPPNSVAVDYPVFFAPTYTGTKDVVGYARDYAASTLCKFMLGSWTVPANNSSVSLQPASLQVGPNETRASFAVASAEGCPWLLTPDSAWFTIDSPLGGSGNGTVNLRAFTNIATAARTGKINVSGVSFTLGQDGRQTALPPPSIFSRGGSNNAVLNAASFSTVWGGSTFLAITGANLSASERVWGAEDFVDGCLPTRLDGVSVTVNGKPAYI